MAKTKSERLKELLKELLIEEAKKRDWDELASDIINLEQCVRMETNAKLLKLLNQKLEIWEQEKSLRVFNTFKIESFMPQDPEVF